MLNWEAQEVLDKRFKIEKEKRELLEVSQAETQDSVSSVRGVVSQVSRNASRLQGTLPRAINELYDASTMSQVEATQHRRYNSVLTLKLSALQEDVVRQGEALAGNIYLYTDLTSVDVSAADLNTALSGTYKKELMVSLVSTATIDEQTYHSTHSWANIPVVLSSSIFSDPDIDIPMIKNFSDPDMDLAFYVGILHAYVMFDTDAGTTKTYTSGNYVSLEVKVSTDDKLKSGCYVEPIVVTYNVIT